MTSHLQRLLMIAVLVLDFILAYGAATWIWKRNWFRKVSSAALLQALDKSHEAARLIGANDSRRVDWVQRYEGTGRGQWEDVLAKLNQSLRQSLRRQQQRYRQAGYSLEEAPKMLSLHLIMGGVLPLGIATVQPIRAAVVLIAIEGFRRWHLRRRRLAFEAQFKVNLYKVYRFLCTQLNAGHSAVDILRHVHLAAADKSMRNALNAFTGAYFRTLNFDRSALELTQRYPICAAETLLTILRQGIESGEAKEMIQRQEEVMIQQYLESIALKNERVQIQLILLVILSGSITFLILAIPLALQMLEALEMLFA